MTFWERLQNLQKNDFTVGDFVLLAFILMTCIKLATCAVGAGR